MPGAGGQALTANAFTRAGYDFRGWNTSASGSSVQYTDGAAVKNLSAENNAVVKLYAVRAGQPVQVTVNRNDGSEPTVRTGVVGYNYNYIYENGSARYNQIPDPTRTGYIFLGWFDAPEGGTEITHQTKFADATPVTLYAHWQEGITVHFDGNGYSDEWKEEAMRRGLDCETSVPRIFDNYLKPETISLFESVGVMTKKELEARNEVKWETYTKKIQIEARVLGDLAMNHIIPVATRYQTDLIDNVYKMKSLFPEEKAARLSAKNLELIEEIADRTAFIKKHVDAMVEARKVANKIESEREKAIAYHDTIVPALEEIRYHIDKLELIVDNQMWTLPKYRELLFIR